MAQYRGPVKELEDALTSAFQNDANVELKGYEPTLSGYPVVDLSDGQRTVSVFQPVDNLSFTSASPDTAPALDTAIRQSQYYDPLTAKPIHIFQVPVANETARASINTTGTALSAEEHATRLAVTLKALIGEVSITELAARGIQGYRERHGGLSPTAITFRLSDLSLMSDGTSSSVPGPAQPAQETDAQQEPSPPTRRAFPLRPVSIIDSGGESAFEMSEEENQEDIRRLEKALGFSYSHALEVTGLAEVNVKEPRHNFF